MSRPWPLLVAALLVAAGLGFGLANLGSWATRGPDPESVASASLQAVRAQNRLVPFAARFVAVVTSTQTRFGLSARKTLIMPGTVRYELDLAALRQRDVRWDAATKTLTVTLPVIRPSAAEIDLAQIRDYDSGGVLMALTDAGARLDQANRIAGQAQLAAQAADALPMRLARDAARAAIERSFALPLRAAGLDATVRARFADEPDAATRTEQVDRTRALADVLADPPRR